MTSETENGSLENFWKICSSIINIWQLDEKSFKFFFTVMHLITFSMLFPIVPSCLIELKYTICKHIIHDLQVQRSRSSQIVERIEYHLAFRWNVFPQCAFKSITVFYFNNIPGIWVIWPLELFTFYCRKWACYLPKESTTEFVFRLQLYHLDILSSKACCLWEVEARRTSTKMCQWLWKEEIVLKRKTGGLTTEDHAVS